jgi:hypothetical protein
MRASLDVLGAKYPGRGQDLGVRIRLNLHAPAGPTGLAVGGEVEDYMVRVVCPPDICVEGSGTK